VTLQEILKLLTSLKKGLGMPLDGKWVTATHKILEKWIMFKIVVLMIHLNMASKAILSEEEVAWAEEAAYKIHHQEEEAIHLIRVVVKVYKILHQGEVIQRKEEDHLLCKVNQNNKCNHGNNNKITEGHHNHRKIQVEGEWIFMKKLLWKLIHFQIQMLTVLSMLEIESHAPLVAENLLQNLYKSIQKFVKKCSFKNVKHLMLKNREKLRALKKLKEKINTINQWKQLRKRLQRNQLAKCQSGNNNH
jgi:hypothetical protein